MPTVTVTSDWHLEAGAKLGTVDEEYGSSRMRDAESVLHDICSELADVLVFAGDLAEHGRPSPLAYQIAASALDEATGDIVLLPGNHDIKGTLGYTNPIDVLAAAIPPMGGREVIVANEPGLHVVRGVQIAALPFTPPSRLFAAAPHSPKAMYALAAKALMTVAHGLAAKIDRARPSLLVGHWYIGDAEGNGAGDPIKERAVVLDAVQLGALGFDYVAFGDYHTRTVFPGERVFHIGAPLRGDFGAADDETGAIQFTWPSANSDYRGERPSYDFIDTEDARLVTLDFDYHGEGEDYWLGGLDAISSGEVHNAVVKLRVRTNQAGAIQLKAENGKLLDGLMQRCLSLGALRVLPPHINKETVERTRRSSLTVETAPLDSLAEWCTQNGVTGDALTDVLREGERVMVTTT